MSIQTTKIITREKAEFLYVLKLVRTYTEDAKKLAKLLSDNDLECELYETFFNYRIVEDSVDNNKIAKEDPNRGWSNPTGINLSGGWH
jgi:hypothetical protein